MEYTEAVEAAVSKRKYLLDSLFDLKDIPKDTSTEDDNLTYEAPKRKFCASLNTWSVETFWNKICNDRLHMLLKIRSEFPYSVVILRLIKLGNLKLRNDDQLFCTKICWNNSLSSVQWWGQFWATNEQRCCESIELSGRDIHQLVNYTQSQSSLRAPLKLTQSNSELLKSSSELHWVNREYFWVLWVDHDQYIVFSWVRSECRVWVWFL